MVNDDEILNSLVKGGLIGAALGTILSRKQGDGAILGAIAGAVLLATFKANETARNANLSVYVEEHGKLYEILAGGEKRFIKSIEKPKGQFPAHFKLI